MDLEKGITAIEKFFFELIGQVIPGGVLTLGLILIIEPSLITDLAVSENLNPAVWLTLIAGLYILGYALVSTSKLTLPIISRLRSILLSGILRRGNYQDINETNVLKNISDNPKYQKMISEMGIMSYTSRDVRDARNYILSRVSYEDNFLVRRFTYVYLLNAGVATALIVILFFSLSVRLLLAFTNIDLALHPLSWLQTVATIFLIGAFSDRYYDFYQKSLRTPFSLYEKSSKVA